MACGQRFLPGYNRGSLFLIVFSIAKVWSAPARDIIVTCLHRLSLRFMAIDMI
jgi:hypothetical protein